MSDTQEHNAHGSRETAEALTAGLTQPVEQGKEPLGDLVAAWQERENRLRAALEEAEQRERDTAAANRLSSDMFEMVRSDLAASEARAAALEQALREIEKPVKQPANAEPCGWWLNLAAKRREIARDALSTPATDEAQGEA